MLIVSRPFAPAFVLEYLATDIDPFSPTVLGHKSSSVCVSARARLRCLDSSWRMWHPNCNESFFKHGIHFIVSTLYLGGAGWTQ